MMTLYRTEKCDFTVMSITYTSVKIIIMICSMIAYETTLHQSHMKCTYVILNLYGLQRPITYNITKYETIHTRNKRGTHVCKRIRFKITLKWCYSTTNEQFIKISWTWLPSRGLRKWQKPTKEHRHKIPRCFKSKQSST